MRKSNELAANGMPARVKAVCMAYRSERLNDPAEVSAMREKAPRTAAAMPFMSLSAGAQRTSVFERGADFCGKVKGACR